MTILVVELLIIEVISRAGSWILEFGDVRGRMEWNRYNNVIKPEQCWGADIQTDFRHRAVQSLTIHLGMQGFEHIVSGSLSSISMLQACLYAAVCD